MLRRNEASQLETYTALGQDLFLRLKYAPFPAVAVARSCSTPTQLLHLQSSRRDTPGGQAGDRAGLGDARRPCCMRGRHRAVAKGQRRRSHRHSERFWARRLPAARSRPGRWACCEAAAVSP
jgi:hypothetical protein